MAVQAQYVSSNLLLRNRGEQEMECSQVYLDQAGGMFFSGAGERTPNVNPKKRGREEPTQGIFALQPPSTFINLTQLRRQPAPFVSTGLKLTLADQKQSDTQEAHPPRSSPSSSSSSLLSTDELAVRISTQKDEIDQFIVNQGEQLRRALVEKQQRHCLDLMRIADEASTQRLRDKVAELNRAARRGVELEDRVNRLRAELMTWQAKAMADQAAAAALQAQIQQAGPVQRDEECGESPDDAGSAHVDADRVERPCRSCWTRSASVVVFPCCHLSLCSECESAACPVCHCHRTGCVEVFFS